MKKVLLIVIFSLLFMVGCHKQNDPLDLNFDFVINDTMEDGNGEEIKIIILAGQSNATGCAYTSILKEKISEEKYAEYVEGYDNVMINYNTENGFNKSDGFKKTNIESFVTFGPEIGLAEILGKEEDQFAIVKYSYGGTNLYQHWNKDNDYLFKGLIKFVQTSIAYLKMKNYQTKIISFLWMQGESDAIMPHAGNYYDHTKTFVEAIRKEFGDIQFVDAGISNLWKEHERINNAKERFSNESENNVYIDTIKEGLLYNEEPAEQLDLAHFDSLSEIKLGHLFAQAVLKKEK